MATRHFCDGCGREPDRKVDLTVLNVSYGEHQNNAVKFDVCGSCLQYFKSNSLPTTWPRAEASKSA